jgi:transcription initiation factor IIF auxiliary subunit
VRAPPYEVRRLGWGTFTIEAEIVLKEPYNWVIDNAGSRQPGLELTWTLDFEGRGRQGRVKAKVQKMEQPAMEDVTSETGEGRRTRSTRQAAMSGNPTNLNRGDNDDDEEADDNYEEADISEFIATPRR